MLRKASSIQKSEVEGSQRRVCRNQQVGYGGCLGKSYCGLDWDGGIRDFKKRIDQYIIWRFTC